MSKKIKHIKIVHQDSEITFDLVIYRSRVDRYFYDLYIVDLDNQLVCENICFSTMDDLKKSVNNFINVNVKGIEAEVRSNKNLRDEIAEQDTWFL